MFDPGAVKVELEPIEKEYMFNQISSSSRNMTQANSIPSTSKNGANSGKHNAEYLQVLEEMPLGFRTRNQSNKLADILGSTHNAKQQTRKRHVLFELRPAPKRQNTAKQQAIESSQESVSDSQNSKTQSKNQRLRKDSDKENSKNGSGKIQPPIHPLKTTEYLQLFEKPDKIFTDNKLIEKFPDLMYYGMEEYRNENRMYM